MKKAKLALLVIAGLLATSAQAQWQGNWVLGVSAGGAWHNDDDLTLTVSQGGPAPVSSSFVFDNSNDNGHFIWGFLAGYQARCNGWLLGAELNIDWRGDNEDDNAFAFTVASPAIGGVAGFVDRDRDVVVGLTGRLGYEVTSYFLPYVRLGVDHSNRDFDIVVTTIAPQSIVTASSDTDNNRNWGFVGGIGAEFPLPMVASGLSLRAEWDYHCRGHNDGDVIALASDGITLFTVNGGNRHEQTARASLVFNFPS